MLKERATIEERATTESIDNLVSTAFGPLRNAISHSLTQADAAAKKPRRPPGTRVAAPAPAPAGGPSIDAGEIAIDHIDRDAARREMIAAEAARAASLVAAREATIARLVKDGMPTKAAEAAAELDETPKSLNGRASWRALSKQVLDGQFHDGLQGEDALRWLLGELELPEGAAATLLKQLELAIKAEAARKAAEAKKAGRRFSFGRHSNGSAPSPSPAKNKLQHAGEKPGLSNGASPSKANGVANGGGVQNLEPEKRNGEDGEKEKGEEEEVEPEFVWEPDESSLTLAGSSGAFDALLECVAAPGPVKSMHTGKDCSFAVCSSGRVLCWGRGDVGQMGLEDPDELLEDEESGHLVGLVPRHPSGLHNVSIAQLSAASHVVAISNDGDLYTWGCAQFGVLGLGYPLDHLPESEPGVRFQPRPTRVPSLNGVAIRNAVACEKHSLAVTESGVALSWGSCASGRLGVPLDSPIIGARGEGQAVDIIEKCAWEPVVIRGLKVLHSARAVAGGSEHSLALSGEGRLYSWGSGRYGKLGLGPIKTLPKQRGEVIQVEPRVINGLREQIVLACACGDEHSMAICVERGQLPGTKKPLRPSSSSRQSRSSSPGGTPNSASPASARAASPSASPPASARRYSKGANGSKTVPGHGAGAAGVVPTGYVTCVFVWGRGTCGRLGVPSDHLALSADDDDGVGGGARFVSSPMRLTSLDTCQITHITAGPSHSIAASESGACFGWGAASFGRLGVGKEDSLPTDEESNELFVEQPMRIRGLAGYQVKSVAAGERHSLACTSTGQVLVWGHASHGRLGFSEGALMMPTEDDGAAYQPLPRMLWLKDEEYSVESSRFSGNQVSADPFKITSSRFQPSEGAWDRGSYG